MIIRKLKKNIIDKKFKQNEKIILPKKKKN